MTESETYWRRLVDELAGITEALSGSRVDLENEPKWVTKLTLELLNMTTPKLQLRVGVKVTADKIGVLIGSHFVQLAQAEAFAQIPKPTAGMARSGYEMAAKLATPPDGFDLHRVQQSLPVVKQGIASVVSRVWQERQVTEVSEFLRGLSRGLKQDSKRFLPAMKDGVPQFTAKQFERVRTIVIYTLARYNWREIDVLSSSQKAFEWFEQRVPQQILGNDPERIRKMFYRLGKRFKSPGRPIDIRDRDLAGLLR